MTTLTRLLASLGLCLALTPALAVQPDEMLDDPHKEQRAQELGEHIRCLVCQNQAIEESNAPLAADMRELVRKRIKAGDSNEEIKAYLTERYGDFVLLKPPMKPGTYALWYGPFVVVALGAVGVAVYFRRRRAAASAAADRLSPEEERRLREVLNERDEAT